jgi:hypothetical protein
MTQDAREASLARDAAQSANARVRPRWRLVEGVCKAADDNCGPALSFPEVSDMAEFDHDELAAMPQAPARREGASRPFDTLRSAVKFGGGEMVEGVGPRALF